MAESDVDALKRAVALAITARCMIASAFKLAGRAPPSLAELRRLSREFQIFEALVPAPWIALIERAVEGDGEALELLDAECERADQPLH